jgi:putative transposase
MFVTLRGEPYLLWRAVDEHGAELDVLVQRRRDTAAAKRFFRRVRHRALPKERLDTWHGWTVSALIEKVI